MTILSHALFSHNISQAWKNLRVFLLGIQVFFNNVTGQCREVNLDGDCLDIFSVVYHFYFLSSSLLETARY